MGVKQVYTAGNREFATEEEAKKHDELLEAQEQLRHNIKRVSWLLGENAKTKDGKQFEWSLLRDYWLLTDWVGREPWLEKLTIYCHYAEVEEDRNEPGIVIRLYEPQSRDGRCGYRNIRINELYASEKNANAALVAAYERYIADVSKRFAKLKAQATP